MATRNSVMSVHPALGGLDLGSDPTVLDPNFLTIADNIEYLEGGQRKKRMGVLQYAPTSSYTGTYTNVMVSSGANVRALADMWTYGATLTGTQRLLSVTSASIFQSTGNGVWTAVTSASSFGTNTNLNTNIMFGYGTTTSGGLGDMAVFSDGVTSPVAYNPTTTTLFYPSSASTSWPTFESAKYHLNRMFYCGISTAPSKLGYTGADNVCDSTGTDAGSLNIAIGDRDRIIGLSETFYGSLYVFKGPNFGSVYQLGGRTPSAFTLDKVAQGAPALSHAGIVSTPTDIYWISGYGIHSLQTTVKYGNVEQAFLSLPIQKLWREETIKRSDFANAHGFWDPLHNTVGWSVMPNDGTRRNWLLVYNYALSDPRPGGKKYWSIWKFTNIGVTAPALVVGTTGGSPASHVGHPHLWFGSDEGLVYAANMDDLNDDAEAYTARVKTPIITRLKTEQGMVPETQEKSFLGVVTYYSNVGAGDCDLRVIVDNRVQSETFSMSPGGDVLG